jgi:hypothetical protein
MVFTSGDLAVICSAIAVLFGAFATYRNSVRRADFEKLLTRVTETEKRLADSERRASDNEQRALEYRQAVIKIGEQMSAERHENSRRLALVAQDGNSKINKVVLVLEQVLKDFEAVVGRTPDVDIDALKRLVVNDHVTGQLGYIDVQAVRNYQ